MNDLVKCRHCYPLSVILDIKWRRQWHPTPVLCLENPMDGGAWQAAVHGVAKSQTRLSDFPFTFHFHALEKEMATHSSVLAWRIPGTGEPGGCRLWDHTELDTTEVTQQHAVSSCIPKVSGFWFSNLCAKCNLFSFFPEMRRTTYFD